MVAKKIEIICDELIHRVKNATFWDLAEPDTTFFDEIINGLEQIRAIELQRGTEACSGARRQDK